MNKVPLVLPTVLFWAIAASAQTQKPEVSKAPAGAATPAATAPAAPTDGTDQIPVVERGPSGDTVVSGPGSGSGAAEAHTPAEPPAGPPAPPAPSVSHPKAPPEEQPKAPPARDTLGGHLAVGAIAGVIVPFGSVDSGHAQSDVFGSGLFLGGDVAYGVSRTVMIGAYGEVAAPAGKGAEAGTDVSTIAAGPLIRYHLVQGPRFDPWLAYGVGFRRTKFGGDSVTGLDWARIVVGGDWYPFDNLGIGPLLELTMGTFLSASGAPLGGKTVNANFVAGGRIVFDSPGK